MPEQHRWAVYIVVERDPVMGQIIRAIFATKPLAEGYMRECKAHDLCTVLSLEPWLVLD